MNELEADPMPAFTTLHEAEDKLSVQSIEFHRAIVSLTEELEAIDWYNQRVDACTDSHLKAILQHNRDEEIEHASMALEWIRRKVPKFDEALKAYLFTEGDVTKIENEVEVKEKSAPEEDIRAEPAPKRAGLTVGEMKEK